MIRDACLHLPGLSATVGLGVLARSARTAGLVGNWIDRGAESADSVAMVFDLLVERVAHEEVEAAVATEVSGAALDAVDACLGAMERPAAVVADLVNVAIEVERDDLIGIAARHAERLARDICDESGDDGGGGGGCGAQRLWGLLLSVLDRTAAGGAPLPQPIEAAASSLVCAILHHALALSDPAVEIVDDLPWLASEEGAAERRDWPPARLCATLLDRAASAPALAPFTDALFVAAQAGLGLRLAPSAALRFLAPLQRALAAVDAESDNDGDEFGMPTDGLDRRVVVVESPHPYPASMMREYEVCLDGALALVIDFDKRSATEEMSDFLEIIAPAVSRICVLVCLFFFLLCFFIVFFIVLVCLFGCLPLILRLRRLWIRRLERARCRLAPEAP